MQFLNLARSTDTSRHCIELIGLPGSGKTTVAKELLRMLGADDGRRLAEGIRALDCLRVAPFATFKALASPAMLSRPGRIVCLTRLRQVAVLRSSNNCIFEEGPIHRAWLLQQSFPGARLVRLPVSPVCRVVYLGVTPEEAHNGMLKKSIRGPVNELLIGHSLTSSVWRRAILDYNDLRRRARAITVERMATPVETASRILCVLGRQYRLSDFQHVI